MISEEERLKRLLDKVDEPIVGGDKTGELPEFNGHGQGIEVQVARLGKQLRVLGEAVEDQNTVTIKVKKLHPDAKLPTKGSEEAACWDVYALEAYSWSRFAWPPLYKVIRTGLAFEVPLGHEIEIRPRSGLSKKARIMNSPGTLDSDYRGELYIVLVPNNGGLKINKGDRIAQIKINRVLPVQFEEVEELSKTDRGDKGFGSTGR